MQYQKTLHSAFNFPSFFFMPGIVNVPRSAVFSPGCRRITRHSNTVLLRSAACMWSISSDEYRISWISINRTPVSSLKKVYISGIVALILMRLSMLCPFCPRDLRAAFYLHLYIYCEKRKCPAEKEKTGKRLLPCDFLYAVRSILNGRVSRLHLLLNHLL